MSMPNIPDLNPNVTVNREDALNVILSSIGMEELSMAHILNAEAEKTQFVLGTLSTSNGKAASMSDILKANDNSNKMLRDVIKNQMLLSMRIEDVVALSNENKDDNTTAPVPEATPKATPEATPGPTNQ